MINLISGKSKHLHQPRCRDASFLGGRRYCAWLWGNVIASAPRRLLLRALSPSAASGIEYLPTLMRMGGLAAFCAVSIAVGGCMSVEPAAPPTRAWSYSPYAPGSQPNPIDVEVPDPVLSGAAPSSPGTRMSTLPIIAESQFQTDLELFQIARLVVDRLSARGAAGSAAGLAAFIKASKVAPAAADPSFPSLVTLTTRACGKADGSLRQWAEARFCKAGIRHYDELRIETFVRWRTTVEISCSDCVGRYTERLNAFTLELMATRLRASGYAETGIVEGQTMGAFPSPLVHSGFTRDAASPLIAVSHRPLTDSAGRTADLPPAVLQLQLYFPATEEN